MSVLDNEASGNLSGHVINTGENYEVESDDDGDSILPDLPSNSGVFKNLVPPMGVSPANSSNNSVLPNCPDITIIKKESKMNNNSDHSEKQLGNSDWKEGKIPILVFYTDQSKE